MLAISVVGFAVLGILFFIFGTRPKQPMPRSTPLPDDPSWPKRMSFAVAAVDWEDGGVLFGEIDPEPHEACRLGAEQTASDGRRDPPWVAFDASDSPDHPIYLTLFDGDFELSTYVALAEYELVPGKALFVLHEESRPFVYGLEQIEITFPPELIPELGPLQSALDEIFTFGHEPMPEGTKPLESAD